MINKTVKLFKIMLFNRYVFLALLLVGIFFAGVFSSKQVFAPDLHRLYMQSMQVKDQPPVIFIHGVLGSRLENKTTQEHVWPGNVSRLLSYDYSDLAFEINPESLEPMPGAVVPSAIFDGAAGQDFYGKIIHTLSEIGGYKLSTVGEKVDPTKKNYYVFLYDWRQDNVKSAAQLTDYIEQIRLDYDDPTLKVDIVAHSMGGLVTRYYMRYGKQDVLDDNDFDMKVTHYGAERVRRVVLLGTPNLGSISTLNYFITGIDIGINQIGTETLATMPSLFQLFPHSLVNWLVTNDGKPLKRDLFDVDIWRRFQWSIFNPEVRERIMAKYENEADGKAHLQMLEAYFEKYLERARRFVWSLSIATPKMLPKLTVFGGACILTPARIMVEEVNGESMIRLFPDEVQNPVAGVDYDALLLEPGDGSVTKASLLGREALDPSVKRHEYLHLPIYHSFFLCESHSSLTGNLNFQDNLLNTLLTRDAQLADDR